MICLAVSAILTALVQGGVPSSVEAQQSKAAAVVAQIKQMEQDRIQIGVRKDMDALAAVTSDDYVQIDWVGKVVGKAATLERIKSSDMQSYTLEGVDVRLYGDTAIVVGTAIRKGVTKDRDISGAFRYTRVYANRNGRWQVVHFQQTRVTETE